MAIETINFGEEIGEKEVVKTEIQGMMGHYTDLESFNTGRTKFGKGLTIYTVQTHAIEDGKVNNEGLVVTHNVDHRDDLYEFMVDKTKQALE